MNEWMKENKKNVLLGGMVVVIAIPMIVYGLSVAPILPSGGNDWAGFWGGYFGALIGAAVTLWGVKTTLEETRRQFKEDKRIEHAPYFRIEEVKCRKDGNKGIYKWVEQGGGGHYGTTINLNIIFENVGLGTAIDFKINKIKRIFNGKNDEKDFKDFPISEIVVDVGEHVLLEFKQGISVNLTRFEEMLKNDGYESGEYTKKIEGSFDLTLEYNDLFQNNYKDSVSIDFFVKLSSYEKEMENEITKIIYIRNQE